MLNVVAGTKQSSIQMKFFLAVVAELVYAQD